MKTRIVIGALLAASFAGLWIWGGLALEIAIYLCAALAIYEVYHAFYHVGIHVPPFTGFFFMILLPLAIHFFGIKGILALYMLMGMLLLAFQVFKADLSLEHTAYSFLILFYPCMMISMLPLMMTFPGETGRIALLMTIVCATFTDMFAYFAGFFLGRHELCPTISPKKTIEGAVGGLLGGIAASVIVGLAISPLFAERILVGHLIVLGVLCGVVAQIGDLAASIIKRGTGIKDFGHIFPGHGGMMDRLDSILFVAPVVYCYFSIVLLA